MKKFLFPVILLITLSSCSTKPELRADIKEFISKFSLEEAMNTYKKGGYIKEIEEINGEKKTLERIEMEFSYLDAAHPSYTKTTTKFVDDVESSKEEVEFVEIESKYYVSTNGELKESSLKECSELINNFFYEKTQIEGEYHTQGMYYGDYILQVAPMLQNYITIDQDQELYLCNYETEGIQKGEKVTYEQHYSVNKMGMLVENHAHVQSKNNSRKTDVVVHD
ncbi:MAG: hypothetical protein IJQ72_02580 [Bacilli bacterium]|nr:hypothetical protein [Bacilli bacterium]